LGPADPVGQIGVRPGRRIEGEVRHEPADFIVREFNSAGAGASLIFNGGRNPPN